MVHTCTWHTLFILSHTPQKPSQLFYGGKIDLSVDTLSNVSGCGCISYSLLFASTKGKTY